MEKTPADKLLLRMLNEGWQVTDLPRDDPLCLELEKRRLIGWKPHSDGESTIWRLTGSGLTAARKLIGLR